MLTTKRSLYIHYIFFTNVKIKRIINQILYIEIAVLFLIEPTLAETEPEN